MGYESMIAKAVEVYTQLRKEMTTKELAAFGIEAGYDFDYRVVTNFHSNWVRGFEGRAPMPKRFRFSERQLQFFQFMGELADVDIVGLVDLPEEELDEEPLEFDHIPNGEPPSRLERFAYEQLLAKASRDPEVIAEAIAEIGRDDTLRPQLRLFSGRRPVAYFRGGQQWAAEAIGISWDAFCRCYKWLSEGGHLRQVRQGKGIGFLLYTNEESWRRYLQAYGIEQKMVS